MPGQQINESYNTAENYPDLARKLIAAGIESYTVDVSSGITIYRVKDGVTHVHIPVSEPRAIEKHFNKEKTIQAIRDNQEGKTTYEGFMDGIAQAGIRCYDAILNGENKRCIYMGIGGYYEEQIPV
jgi:uncharacterized protein YbcV (DUF1398 family)